MHFSVNVARSIPERINLILYHLRFHQSHNLYIIFNRKPIKPDNFSYVLMNSIMLRFFECVDQYWNFRGDHLKRVPIWFTTNQSDCCSSKQIVNVENWLSTKRTAQSISSRELWSWTQNIFLLIRFAQQ